jgi:hypothetical protein
MFENYKVRVYDSQGWLGDKNTADRAPQSGKLREEREKNDLAFRTLRLGVLAG